MILAPGREDEARRVFEKWELDFAVIGRVTETGVWCCGCTARSPPISRSGRWSPRRRYYERPWVRREPAPDIDPRHCRRAIRSIA